MTTVSTGPEAAAPATETAPVATTTTETATATTGTEAGSAEPQKGQADSATQTEAAPKQDDSFFDPRSIKGKPELEAAYKQMQRAYTQKTQAIAEQRRKVEAYDGFVQNPESVVEYLRTLGYQVARQGQAAPQGQQAPASQGAPENKNFEPQTWDDVKSWIKQDLMREITGQIQPIVQNVRETTARNIEKQLEEIDPNWRLYEDDMKETLKQHPTLVKDVGKLYRMAVPDEVLRDRAVKEALAKHSTKTASASVHGTGTTTKTAPAPRKINNFQDAVEAAKDALRQGGGYR